jgi:hypothetical protein
VWTTKTGEEKEKIDPYLVVFANGYETYVSSERIARGNSTVRTNVRMTKVDPAKIRTYGGSVVRADGSPAPESRIGFTVADPGVKVGESTFRWDLSSNIVLRSDASGKFRFTSPRALGKLVFTDPTGEAVVDAQDFEEEKQGVAILGGWARIEGRLLRDGKPDPNLVLQVKLVDLPRIAFQQMPNATIAPDGSFTIERTLAMPIELTVIERREKASPVLVKKIVVEGKAGEIVRADVSVSDEEIREAKRRLGHD